MNPKIKLTLLVLLALVLTLASCQAQPGAEPTATTDPNAVYTAAAQTADARLTEMGLSTPSATPEPPTLTPDPSQTAIYLTAEVALTQAVVLSLTPAAPLPSATNVVIVPVTGDNAQFVLDVTVPDGSDYAPGASFTKTWRIKNTGTTTWSTDFKLTFVSGTQMGAAASVAVPNSVAPGATVDISVAMVAPTTTGNYKGYWRMANAAGTPFGDQIYVDIDVVGTGVAVTGTPGATVTPGPTVTPGGPTATPTPTVTPTSGTGVVTSLTMAVDYPAYAGTCPKTLTFAATFTVNQSTSLTYQLEAGSTTPGFVFNLPGAADDGLHSRHIHAFFPVGDELLRQRLGAAALHLAGGPQLEPGVLQSHLPVKYEFKAGHQSAG